MRDLNGTIRSAQIIQYDEQGHTIKYTLANGETKRRNNWLHNALKKRFEKTGEVPDWLKDYSEKAPKFPCLFGEHLLKAEPLKPVALVESAKTAIIASEYLPEFIWLAVGSLSNLTPERCISLERRNVVLFPDLGAYDAWRAKAEKISRVVAKVAVSDLLERKATPEER